MTNLKTTLLAATALTMVAGAAWANSNTANSTSNGDANTVNIDQSSIVNGHKAKSTLNGDRNNVLVIQKNTNASSDGFATTTILVDGQNGGDNNTIEVRQDAFNSNPFSATDKISNIDVYGDRNTIKTNQQFGSKLEPNAIAVTVRGDDDGTDNRITIDQTNNGQSATATVWGDFNTVNVKQVAGSSRATVTIDGTANGDDGEGDGNLISINQLSGGGHIAGTTVYGDGNVGTINQNGLSNFADIKVGDVSRDGDNNTFVINQSGTDNDAYGAIFGAYNMATVTQTGTLGVASFLQDGNNNTVSISQVATGNNAVSNQTGNFNSTTITQN